MPSRVKKEKPPKAQKAVVLLKDDEVVDNFCHHKDGRSVAYASEKDKQGNQILYHHTRKVAQISKVNDEEYFIVDLKHHDLSVLETIRSHSSYAHFLNLNTFQPIKNLEEEWNKTLR